MKKLTGEEIIDRLCRSGFDTYIVGGAVRDLLAGHKPKDEDIVTKARPEEIAGVFPDAKVSLVGKSFGVVLVDGVEVATFRSDRYAGLDAKQVEVSFSETITDDLIRRDLTINALAFCQYTGDVVDVSTGVDDLKKCIIRFVGEPKDRILEDPNRIIRACRFLAKIDGKFEKGTFNALREHAHLVESHVAPERIRVEIMKAMDIRGAGRFFYALHDIGALQYILPSLDDCFGHGHGNHHFEDVFEHSLFCGDGISGHYPLTKLAGYLHDVGKPDSFEPNEKTFLRHEDFALPLIERDLKRLKFSNNEVKFVVNLVSVHMKSLKDITPKGLMRLLRELGGLGLNYQQFLRLRVADRHANLRKDRFTIQDVRNLLDDFNRVAMRENVFSIRNLKVSGDDVMSILGIKPGPEVGKALKMLFDRVKDSPELNERETLIKFLKEG